MAESSFDTQKQELQSLAAELGAQCDQLPTPMNRNEANLIYTFSPEVRKRTTVLEVGSDGKATAPEPAMVKMFRFSGLLIDWLSASYGIALEAGQVDESAKCITLSLSRDDHAKFFTLRNAGFPAPDSAEYKELFPKDSVPLLESPPQNKWAAQFDDKGKPLPDARWFGF